MKRIAILASGTGTNAQALLEASAAGLLGPAKVVAVFSDREGAGALDRARAAAVEAVFVDPAGHPDRIDYAETLAKEIESRNVDLICLAGFMRILPPAFVQKFQGQILNIHPALLPSFPGAQAVRDALDWGAKVSGATVHFVDEEVDHGPIVAQEAVEILEDDSQSSLHERIKQAEHRIYPLAVRAVVEGRTSLDGRRVFIDGKGGANA